MRPRKLSVCEECGVKLAGTKARTRHRRVHRPWLTYGRRRQLRIVA